MEGEATEMKEIKVMVFVGNLAELVKSSMKDTVLSDRFSKYNGYTVQQLSYGVERVRDEVGTAYGESEGVEVDFTIRVMDTELIVFYEKLKDLASECYTFIFNGTFEGDLLKHYDNAMMVDGFVVDVEECAANDKSQALMHVKLLARELIYIHHDGSNLSINISNSH